MQSERPGDGVSQGRGAREYECGNCGAATYEHGPCDECGKLPFETDGGEGLEDGPDPWCTWCDNETEDGQLPFRIHGRNGRWPPAFCSLECAARWGCAADQDRIYHVERRDELRTDGGESKDEPKPDPTIYDVVELPESEKGDPCPLAVGPRDDIEICEQPVEYVFVYEASLDPEDDRRRNCLACSECIGPTKPLVTDGGITNEELYEAAIEAWGEDAQINLLGEESAELSAEVSRFMRGRSDVADLAEEVADAEIMIEQARLILGERAIREARVKKLDRLLSRLREAGSDV